MPEIEIREIRENDLENGFLETLDFLRNASDLDKNKAKEILEKIKQNSNQIIQVAIDDKKIVGWHVVCIYNVRWYSQRLSSIYCDDHTSIIRTCFYTDYGSRSTVV